MSRAPVRVFVRFKPTTSPSPQVQAADRTVTINYRQPEGAVVNNARKRISFTYDKVLVNASQEEVFETVGRGAVDAALCGMNSTVMAYGQTGSGKTYTTIGHASLAYHQRGIAPRIIETLFERTQREGIHVGISIACVEVQNEGAFDVASGRSVKTSGPDACMVPVSCTKDAILVLYKAQSNRTVEAHALNENSSRAHFICAIKVTREGPSGVPVEALIQVVDLAGSERQTSTDTPSDGLVSQAKYINRSLAYLEQVVTALNAQSQARADKAQGGLASLHVPFRACKLTQLLASSLAGVCKMALVVTVCSEDKFVDATASSLRFGARMSGVTTASATQLDTVAAVNEVQAGSKLGAEVVRLQMEVERLRGILLANNIGLDGVKLGQATEQVEETAAPIQKTQAVPEQKLEGSGTMCVDHHGFSVGRVMRAPTVPRYVEVPVAEPANMTFAEQSVVEQAPRQTNKAAAFKEFCAGQGRVLYASATEQKRQARQAKETGDAATYKKAKDEALHLQQQLLLEFERWLAQE